MIDHIIPRKFMIRVFLAILLSGLLQVLLLGGVSILFSSRMIEDSLSRQSEGRMNLLVSRMNLSLQEFREMLIRIARDDSLNRILFNPANPDKDILSFMYQKFYRELAGNLDNASIHMVNIENERTFSTHVLPAKYNPDSVEQSISSYLKFKKDNGTFTVVDSFVNPKGDRIAFAQFQRVENSEGGYGYLIADVNASYLAGILDRINADFFTNIYLVDQATHMYINLFREDDAGNFSKLEWRVPAGEKGTLKSNGSLVVYTPLYQDEIMLVGTLRLSTAERNFRPLIRMILFVSLAGLLLSSFLAFNLARMITKPMKNLIEGMKSMEKGNLDIRLDITNGDEFDILIHGFNDMVEQIQGLLKSRVEKEKALRDAERKALQAQINPHFLYNTLNTVKALSKLHGIEEITTIITQLGKLLRNSMDGNRELIRLEESRQLIEGYLQIQEIRIGKNFSWDILMDEECRNVKVPRLLIQPLVENAVIHGVGNLTGMKHIEVSIKGSPPVIRVGDNGPGIDKAVWEKAVHSDASIGLNNVQKRLQLYYEGNKTLKYSREKEYTVVTMELGVIKEEFMDD